MKGLRVVLASVAFAAWLSSVPGVMAQTPAASLPSIPTASPALADCGAVAAILPRTIDDQQLHMTITEGVAAIDPDDLLDPLLASLGRTRDDVCLVAFRFGAGSGSLAGELLRIAGADTTGLGERFAAALHDRLVAYGARASASPADIDGAPAWQLGVVAGGQASDIVIDQLGDTLLLTSGLDALRRLLPLLAADGAPLPSPSAVPASPVDQPTGSGGSAPAP